MKNLKFWFVTGSQDLYGEETLKEVAVHSNEIVDFLNSQDAVKYEVVFKPVVLDPSKIYETLTAAMADNDCAGVITWMHTFSPSKMWINGLKTFTKPILHFHTQYNRDIPWNEIDMDFMNTNQSAHGDREHGYIFTRMGIKRKVIAGHFQDPTVVERIGRWLNVAAVAYAGKDLKVMRLGDNMREVAVTCGDKIEAQIKLGWQVNYHPVGDFVEFMDKVTDAEVDALYEEYKVKYTIVDDVLNNPKKIEAVKYQAKLEIAILNMLKDGGFDAYTNTFQDLHGLKQLPGLASQRAMEAGYGFGPEGDWKISALLRAMKMMSGNKGTSLMEDYTYHFEPGKEAIMGSHMLEVCPTVAGTKPTVEVHDLGIGGKEAPARLKFTGHAAPAICVSLVDLGNRFRLIIQDVNAIEPMNDLPNLPVASVLWQPEPSMQTGCEAWIYSGGAHHSVFSYEVTAQDMIDFAEILDIEYVHINKDTKLNDLKRELQVNDLISKLK